MILMDWHVVKPELIIMSFVNKRNIYLDRCYIASEEDSCDLYY